MVLAGMISGSLRPMLTAMQFSVENRKEDGVRITRSHQPEYGRL
jgi:hypothetical protein